MTDTVNVPREVFEYAVAALRASSARLGPGSTVIMVDEALRLLAAAPKAEPVRWTEDMERESRESDYERGFCDGQLSQPQAPKVEQEPVMVPEVFWSWLVERGLAPDDHDFEWNDIVEILNEHENEITHPAPASDELLEATTALVGIVEGVGVLNHGKWTDEHGLRLKDTPEWASLYVAIDKHKGPQS